MTRATLGTSLSMLPALFVLEACIPEVTDLDPENSVDSGTIDAFGTRGTGDIGGTGGTGGTGVIGTGGTGGADGGTAGTGGAGGRGGTGGTGGMGGVDGGTAGTGGAGGRGGTAGTGGAGGTGGTGGRGGTGGTGVIGTGGAGGTGGCGGTAGTGGSGGSSIYGPQATITCPAGSINISPGQDIPTIVDGNPVGASFCILAGTYYPTRPINPKPNQKLIGQYGAIIDGRNVKMTYDIGSTSIIRGWNCNSDCSGVTVKNLVLRSLAAHNCIGVYSPYANNWTIDHNEIHGCHQGVNVGIQSGARITNNYIHHNIGDVTSSIPAERGFGFGGYQATNTLFESNHVAHNGTEQKWSITTNVTTRNNWIHHNAGDGIWYDGDNVGALIEGNLVEDQPREGIFYEISGPGIIRNNTVRRSGTSGIFISTSRDVEIYGNTLEDNYRGINLFVNCAALGFPYVGSIGFDLRNINAYDNVIKVGSQMYASTSSIGYTACTTAQFAQYTGGSKNLVFKNNKYFVPSLTGSYWFWAETWKTLSQWQAIPQDSGATVALGSVSLPAPAPTPCADTTTPTVAISTPPESATVSGTVTITGSASDNIGVVGVQFKVDGVNVGSEDTTAPYAATWNTTAYTNGAHTMTAIARDAAGNTRTTPGLVVYVTN